MKVGDLVRRKRSLEFSNLKDFNSLAIIVGFDAEGDLLLTPTPMATLSGYLPKT